MPCPRDPNCPNGNNCNLEHEPAPEHAPEYAIQNVEQLRAALTSDERLQQLWDYLSETNDANTDLGGRVNTMTEELVNAQQQNAALQQQLHQARQAVPQPPAPPPVAAASVQRSKGIPDPTKFDGTREQLETFQKDVAVKLAGNADWYPNLQDKLRYIYSLLTGKAKDQVVGKVRLNGSLDFDSVEAMLTALALAFGDPDRRATAQQRIRDLRQKNKTFAEYYAEFSREAPYTEFEPESLKSILDLGLSQEMHDALTTVDTRTMDLAAFVANCQAIDNRLHRNLVLHGARKSIFKTPTSGRSGTPSTVRSYSTPLTPTPAPLTTSQGGSAMDLSAAQTDTSFLTSNGKLPPAQSAQRRAYRMQQGLCLYCGKKGCTKNDHPPPPSRRALIAAVETTDEEQGNGVAV